MMSTLIDIADAMVAELNAANLSMAFIAERYYVPDFDLSEMDELHVSVIPKRIDVDYEAGTREEQSHTYDVDVGVQERFEEGNNVELDPYMDLVEEIEDVFRLHVIDSPKAVCVGVENSPPFGRRHFLEKRQFTSVLTFTWKVSR